MTPLTLDLIKYPTKYAVCKRDFIPHNAVGENHGVKPIKKKRFNKPTSYIAEKRCIIGDSQYIGGHYLRNSY